MRKKNKESKKVRMAGKVISVFSPHQLDYGS